MRLVQTDVNTAIDFERVIMLTVQQEGTSATDWRIAAQLVDGTVVTYGQSYADEPTAQAALAALVGTMPGSA